MQSFRSHIPPTIFETFPRAISSAAISRSTTTAQTKPVTASPITPPSNSQQSQALRQFQSQSSRQYKSSPAMSSSSSADFSQYKIETTSFPSGPGVQLSEQQQLVTCSVLDLFAGKPSLRKLSLWADNATFTDPLTIAEGRKQYSAQWYGLPAVFSQIERLGGSITSSGNPIEMDLKTRYTVKGLGSQQTIDSKIKIFTEGEGDNLKISRVEDRWDDNLPDSTFKNAMRNLNSVVVPKMVSVPNSIEEEEGKKS